MKKLFHPNYLPLFALVMGALCALVRLWLFTSTDSKGLLAADHPGHWLTWLITAAVAVCLFLGTRNLKEAPKFSFNFPANTVSAVGRWAAAAMTALFCLMQLLDGPDSLEAICAVAGIAAAACLGYLGWNRMQGKHPSLLFHAVICIYLMLRLVCQYRLWSSDPQIQNYCFSLLATVCLMLSNYYAGAFDADMGQRTHHTLTHLGAVYFCIAALPYSGDPLFYIAMTVWMITDLCDLTPMPREAA